MSNTNLFYSLYSTSNDTVSAGYTCSSAVDEADTSFDISGDSGVITDSNGDTLASIDLSALHEAGLTQYNVETRIIQPYSCYLLQGQEYGYAYTSYYYPIIGSVSSADGYEAYCNITFDIVCDYVMADGFHVEITANGDDSFVDLLNDELSANNIYVTTSIQVLTDPITNKTSEYLVFLSQKEGFFYYVKNVRLDPIIASADYPDSPFSDSLDDMKSVLYDLIEQFHPTLPGEEYDEDDYEVNCNLYKWLIQNYAEAIEQLPNFKRAVQYLQLIDSDTTEDDINRYIQNANIAIAGTVYDSDVINSYDDDNMEIILELIEALETMVNENTVPSHVWLREEVQRRIPVMKYPNGAFRGIVLIPDWPTNTDDYDYASLWINHITDQIPLVEPVKNINSQAESANTGVYQNVKEEDILYKKRTVGVLANATLISEENCCTGNVRKVTTNGQFSTQIEDGYEDGSDCETYTFNDNYNGPFAEDHPAESTIFMGRSYYSHRQGVIGLYRYLQYITQEHLWTVCGTAYMIIGKADDTQEKTRNLPSSLLVYNPNDVPIRIKYMIFS